MLKLGILKPIFAKKPMNFLMAFLLFRAAKQTVETANLWIAIVGTLFFLIAFNSFINLLNNIANPIKELTASIKEIANRNYSERVQLV